MNRWDENPLKQNDGSELNSFSRETRGLYSRRPQQALKERSQGDDSKTTRFEEESFFFNR